MLSTGWMQMEPPTLLQFSMSTECLAGVATAQANFKKLAANMDQEVLDFTDFGKNTIKVSTVNAGQRCYGYESDDKKYLE